MVIKAGPSRNYALKGPVMAQFGDLIGLFKLDKPDSPILPSFAAHGSIWAVRNGRDGRKRLVWRPAHQITSEPGPGYAAAEASRDSCHRASAPTSQLRQPTHSTNDQACPSPAINTRPIHFNAWNHLLLIATSLHILPIAVFRPLPQWPTVTESLTLDSCPQRSKRRCNSIYKSPTRKPRTQCRCWRGRNGTCRYDAAG